MTRTKIGDTKISVFENPSDHKYRSKLQKENCKTVANRKHKKQRLSLCVHSLLILFFFLLH